MNCTVSLVTHTGLKLMVKKALLGQIGDTEIRLLRIFKAVAACEPRHAPLSWDELRDYEHAGLGFHSPNMEATHRLGLRRQATVNDQEAIATLILSGCYIGFLPDHYAETLLRSGDIRRVVATGSTDDVRFVAIQRRSPAPTRIGEAFLERLRGAHTGAS
jgi:DNA-binding transcriptional LysR family regulator